VKLGFSIGSLVPAFFVGSPVALMLAAALFQLGVLPAGVALLVSPVITTLAARLVLNRI